MERVRGFEVAKGFEQAGINKQQKTVWFQHLKQDKHQL